MLLFSYDNAIVRISATSLFYSTKYFISYNIKYHLASADNLICEKLL